MDWQQKAAALDALAEISVMIRKPGDWYVSQRVEIKDGGILRGDYGNGETPQAAIEDHWRNMVDNIGSRYLVAHAGTERRRAVRWNGFMWMDIPERTSVAA